MTNFLNTNLLENIKLFQFPAYTNIYFEEQEQNFLFFLVKGQVQCTNYQLNGKMVVIALVDPFSVIGDLEIFSREGMNSNVLASKETVMLGIPKKIVQNYGSNDPKFLRFLIDQLQKKLYSTNSVQKGSILSAINRLSLYILSQPKTFETNTVLLPDKKNLAALIGTTQRHLNRIIKELVISGGISRSYPNISVLNKTILQDYIEN